MSWGKGLLAVVTVAVLLQFFTTVLKVDFATVERFLTDRPRLAPVLFFLLMVIGILVAPVPTSPLTMMSPKLFGLWGGLALTLASATAGAAIAFLIARTLGNRFLERFPQYHRWRHLLPAETTAFAVFILRLPPSPTFDAVSYLAGLTSMPLWQFLLATFLGMVPVTAALCLAGSLVPSVWLWPLLAGVILFSLIRIWRAAKGKNPR